MIYTNLSHEFLLSFVWMRFLRFRGNHDIKGIKETQKLKLGDAQVSVGTTPMGSLGSLVLLVGVGLCKERV